MRQTKLTKAARGRECQVRIPGVCNGNPETTVLAHRQYHAEGVMRTQALLLNEGVLIA